MPTRRTNNLSALSDSSSAFSHFEETKDVEIQVSSDKYRHITYHLAILEENSGRVLSMQVQTESRMAYEVPEVPSQLFTIDWCSITHFYVISFKLWFQRTLVPITVV